MAISFSMPLTNSRGFARVVHFRGLEAPMVIAPSLLGEPILTAQGLYLLARTECVARVRFEKDDQLPHPMGSRALEMFLEDLVDTYLFEFVARFPKFKMTSKSMEHVYWRIDSDQHYFTYDWNEVDCLALDTLNDESLLDVSNDDFKSKDWWGDWCLVKNYTESMHADYEAALKRLLRVNVNVTTKGHTSLSDGTHTLPLLRPHSRLLTLSQMEMLDVITPGELHGPPGWQLVSRGFKSDENFLLPRTCIEVDRRYDRQLLSYFFCAIREKSSAGAFMSLYNVLEYYFEYYRDGLGVHAPGERAQLTLLVQYHTDEAEMRAQIAQLEPNWLSRVTATRPTSGGVAISGLDMSPGALLASYASRLYDIRCACVHSKMTRKGQPTPRLVPTTSDEEILEDEINLLRWLSMKCIRHEAEVK